MADVIVDNLLLELRIRADALERGLAAAEDRIDQFTNNTKSAAKQQASAVKASAQEQAQAHTMVAVASAAAFAIIVSATKAGIDAANQYTSALKGLRSVAEGTGQNFGTIQAALNDLTADGLIPVSDAATGLKNLLSRGFEADQAVNMLVRLKDSAAFGRQASLSMGEAVRSATEGLKNENSILVDNAGVTKNVSVMWKEYAQQIGKGVESLTLAEKRQAEYNGIMQETRFQIGDAAKYAATFAGTQAELGAATLKTQQSFGSAVQDGIRPFAQAMIPAVNWIERLIGQNPALTAGLTSAAAAALVTAGGISAVALAGKQLTVVLGALGASAPWIAGIGLVIGLLVTLAAASTEAAGATAKAAAEIQESINTSRQEQATLKGYQDLVASGTATHAELAAAREKIIQQSPELIAGYDAEGNAILGDSDAIKQKIGQLQEYIDMQQEALRASAGATFADADEQRKQAIEDQQKALINYNKELENLANLSAQKATMKSAGVGFMEFDGQLVYLEQVETQLLGVQDRLKAYKQDWVDALHSQQAADTATASMNALLMQDQINAIGLVSEAQRLAAEETMQYALENNKSLEEFNALLQQKLQNVEYMASVEQRLKQGALENSDAVKQWADQEKNLENIRKASTAVAEARKLTEYVKLIKEGKKGTKEYNEAKKALVKAFGGEEDAVKDNIEGYDKLAGNALAGAIDAEKKLKASLQAAITSLKAAGGTAIAAAADLQVLLDMWDQLVGSMGADTTSSGGGGSPRKKAWEEELELIERVADASDEYARQYLDHINGLLQNDALSSKERQRLEKEREYAVLAVNGDLEQAHIEYLERLLQRERLTAEQRLDIEKRLFDAQRALMAQYTELANTIVSAYTGMLEAQRDAQLSAIQDQISAVQERANKEIEAIRKTADAQVDAINEQIRALDNLSKAQDRADKDAEDNDKLLRLQKKLEYEKDGRNRQKLLEQIATLEESITKRHAQEQLDDQKQALRDQQEIIRNEADKQIEIIQDQVEREQAALNRRLASAQKYWDNRLQLENVQREALQFMINASEAEIIALLKAYAPEYFDASAALGQAAYDALKPKMDAIIAAADRMADSVVADARRAERALRDLANAYAGGGGTGGRTPVIRTSVPLSAKVQAFASAPGDAAARMYNNLQRTMDGVAFRSIQPAAATVQAATLSGGGKSAAGVRVVKVEQNVTLNNPVPSPYQTARALRRESERLAKLF